MTMTYMDDLDRRRSRAGCFALIGLAVLVVGLVAWFAWGRRDRGLEPVAAAQVDQATTDVVAASGPAPEKAERSTRRTQAERGAAPPPADDQGAVWLREAKAAREANNLLQARALGWQILDESKDHAAREGAKELLGEVNIELIMTPYPTPEKEPYTIQSGDLLYLIARRNNMNLEHLFHSNRIRGPIERPAIRVGDVIQLFNGSFSIEVSKSRNEMILYMNDRFFKRYPVGTGEFGSTPVGEFKIVNRQSEPVWYRPADGRVIPYGHEENLLGTHWLGFNVRGYGIHGTWQPETIGHQLSDGCVRMLNDDVKEVFTLVTINTPVVITE